MRIGGEPVQSRRVQLRTTYKNGIGIVPKVPEDPEPHGPADQLGLELLLLGQLGVLSVLGLDVRSASSSGTQH